ncbi:unnamed protein product [Meganyctiphanes norvegica]|uniref:T-cell immunomodulatory protein TIP C2 domain-containing protein n=1 Tax=Meganyctiphanes norvegica TaxID=48144 RepID=A0AAV2PL41_MEGNR
MLKRNEAPYFIVVFSLFLCNVSSVNITNQVFGDSKDYSPAAFGDFNSDKLIDMFVLQDDGKTLQVLIAYAEEPYLRKDVLLKCTYKNMKIKSVVPSDFDGNGAMDVMIVSFDKEDRKYNIFVLWGNLTHIDCGDENDPLLKMNTQPLILDYNGDMISDIFGEDDNGLRNFWTFHNNAVTSPTKIPMLNESNVPLRLPSSNAFIDLDNDLGADIWITTDKAFEVWTLNNGAWRLNETIEYPHDMLPDKRSQSSFADVNLDGTLEVIVPVMNKKNCNLAIYDFETKLWSYIPLNLKDSKEKSWYFPTDSTDIHHRYLDTITLRVGDYNLDGYPDILVTLVSESKPRITLLENTASPDHDAYERVFVPQWGKFDDFGDSVMGTFFDFQEDGSLDFLLVQVLAGPTYKVGAYKNAMEYDAMFVKVLVPSGRCYSDCPLKNIPYGTNQPGPAITYSIVTADGDIQRSVSTQLSQTAHFALQLPYTIFGLGRNYNFVEVLKLGIPRELNMSKTITSSFPQIIPNSQLIVIPYPTNNPDHWVSKLYIQPSKAMIMTGGALVGTCLFVAAIIAVLHHREKKQDYREKQQDSHKFHFDAM